MQPTTWNKAWLGGIAAAVLARGLRRSARALGVRRRQRRRRGLAAAALRVGGEVWRRGRRQRALKGRGEREGEKRHLSALRALRAD